MSVNLTLVFEVIAFLAFIYTFKRLLWTPIIHALENRQKTIADGLAAGEEGKRELAAAEQRAEEWIGKARERASEIIENANRRAGEIVAEARGEAEAERRREVERAHAEIEQASRQAREVLRSEFARVAAEAAGRILEREVDPKRHESLVEEMAESLAHG